MENRPLDTPQGIVSALIVLALLCAILFVSSWFMSAPATTIVEATPPISEEEKESVRQQLRDSMRLQLVYAATNEHTNGATSSEEALPVVISEVEKQKIRDQLRAE